MVLQATDLEYITISEAAAAFRARRLSPVELTQQLIERSERLQEALCAFVTPTFDLALSQARAAEAALLRGDDASPLLGIPMGYKDIYCTAGIRTTGGSQLLKDFVPDITATTVALMQEAGAVMLGKLATWEFAGGGADITHSYIPSARNPWDRTRSPYGSSSGSGTALAAGLVTGALGTDTGGSIRFPAAACGVTGLKPTYGRCSRWGVFPAAWSLDHTGPMARTVEDCAIMLDALAGYDPRDPASATEPVQDYTIGLNRSIKGLRIGLPAPNYFDGADPEIVAALNAAVDVLRDLGAVVKEVRLSDRAGGYISPEGHAYYRTDLLETPAMFGPNLAQRHLLNGAYFAIEFLQILRLRSIVKEELHHLLLEVDVVVMPTMARPAETMEVAAANPVADRDCPSFARQFNQAGLPSLSLPNGFSSEGLPLSLMISGRPFDEATVLRAGHAYQQATDWHRRHPNV